MYTSLHNHTMFSNSRLLDSINKPEELIDYAFKLGLKGIAITDHSILSAHMLVEEHIEKRKKENPDNIDWQNFKVIRGDEIYLVRNGLTQDNFISKQDYFYHFVLIALDGEGHKQLRQLSSRAYQRAWFRNMVRVPTYYSDIEEIIGSNPGHVYGLSACLGGFIPKHILDGNFTEVNQFIEWALKTFDGLFSLELQPSKEKEQILVNKTLIQIAKEYNIDYVITTDSHYLYKDERHLHKAFLNAKHGEREVDSFYATTYLMDANEIHQYMDSQIGVNAVDLGLQNTNKIATMVKNYSLKNPLKIPYMPKQHHKIMDLPLDLVNSLFENIPLLKVFADSKDADNQLAYYIIEYFVKNPKEINTKSMDRIQEELIAIKTTSDKMNVTWSKYLLQMKHHIELVWDYADTLVGAGRGSAVSFYINYILGITQVDPMKEKTALKSWRFLNPERASVLDIDIDLQSNRREKVIATLKQEYGALKTLEVAAFGTETAKSAIKTACRAYNIDVDEANYLSSLITADRGILHTLSQTYYGDEENDISSNRKFVTAMNKYPKVWELAQRIEGLVTRIGKHASGIVITEEDFTEYAAIMATNKLDLISQFDLGDLEKMGCIKIDMLSIEALDKIRATLDLLIQYGYIQPEATLKATYEKVLGVYNLERNDLAMWDMVHQNKVISLFQLEQNSGIQAIALTKPTSVEELAAINSIMRLMSSERGAEQPLEKYTRFKQNLTEWDEEMISYGLTKEERLLLHSYLDIDYGMCATQEDLMMLVQDPMVGGFSLAWSDALRKSIAKKKAKDFDKLEEEFFTTTKDKGISQDFANYVWRVLLKTQKGYSFNKSHTLSYSIIALQELNLAYKYPLIFWNTANIIVDSSGTDLLSKDDEEEDTTLSESQATFWGEDYEEEVSDATINYGKVASAIGRMQSYGVTVKLPDINKSRYTFAPDIEENVIYYGLKGIARLNNDIIEEIMRNRPYNNIEDIFNKLKMTKPQMVNLIKSGALDSFGFRLEIMREYLFSVADLKQQLNLRNVQMLLEANLLTDPSIELECRIFNFNKYLRKSLAGGYYILDETAMTFYEKYFDIDQLDFSEGTPRIRKTYWDKLYTAKMLPIKNYIKQNHDELLKQLNESFINELWEKYADGTLSQWEMDSVSFYYHEHELSNIKNDLYEIIDFFALPEEAEVDYSFITKEGYEVNMNKLTRIAGTVLDKDKTKRTVTILTTSGVVTVKMWGDRYSTYDKQISELQITGKKKIIEKSWFSRGNKVIFTGVRQGHLFIPKTYKNSKWKHSVNLIENVNPDGTLNIRMERKGA